MNHDVSIIFDISYFKLKTDIFQNNEQIPIYRMLKTKCFKTLPVITSNIHITFSYQWFLFSMNKTNSVPSYFSRIMRVNPIMTVYSHSELQSASLCMFTWIISWNVMTLSGITWPFSRIWPSSFMSCKGMVLIILDFPSWCPAFKYICWISFEFFSFMLFISTEKLLIEPVKKYEIFKKVKHPQVL